MILILGFSNLKLITSCVTKTQIITAHSIIIITMKLKCLFLDRYPQIVDKTNLKDSFYL
jgi:hypothetical protein